LLELIKTEQPYYELPKYQKIFSADFFGFLLLFLNGNKIFAQTYPTSCNSCPVNCSGRATYSGEPIWH